MYLLATLLTIALSSSAGGRPRCGGVLTAARGILQTPNFPHSLPVPIHCEWVIDAQNLASANTSIIVYLTQLYVHEGLTFTEYQLYDRTYQLDGRLIHTVNETNVVQVRWVQSFQSYLVVVLKLDSIDSAHLRVLDRLLDVYGFNITYEIVRGRARSDSCTMMDCGFNGFCYDHYTKFSCDCFPGYSGARCSSGPSSFCGNGLTSTCKNGGTCIHVGASAVRCHCQKGFTGDTCQLAISTIKSIGCDNCVTSCPFDGKLENACKCKNGNITGINTSERVGFTSTMHLSNLPNLSGDSLKKFIEKQILRTMKSNYSKIDDVSVENVMHFRSGADVTFHLFAMKKDEKRIRAILGKWADRGYIANLTVADREFVFGPLLDLQSVSINQLGVIRQHDEFILSCVARGSPSMSFRWFKDGIFVNVTEITSHKWSRLIKDPHLEDQYTALLGVERSDILDSGTFTCQVEDFHMQQCLSRRVLIKAAPQIKVEPMSLTVGKGANFTIKCISNGNGGKYTYSWTKNKELLPVRTDSEKYEILYPGGSILQVFHVEKSVKYSCLVQDDAISNEITVDVRVVNPNLVRTCPPHIHLNVTWPETAPDTDALQECPKGYAFPGYVRRSCTLSDGLSPMWQLPDYSQCTSDELYQIGRKIQLLHLGYETTSALDILQSCAQYLSTRSGGLLPGEGARILLLLRDVISYRRKVHSASLNMTRIVFELLDFVLLDEHAIINQAQVKLLQEVVNEEIEVSAKLLSSSSSQSMFNLSRSSLDMMLMKEQDEHVELSLFKLDKFSSNYWLPYKLMLDLKQLAAATTIGVVVYKNLAAFLPARSVLRLFDGAEVEYEIISQILRVSTENSANLLEIDWYLPSTIKLNRTNSDGWYMKCAMSDVAMYAYTWNTSVCLTLPLNSSVTRCKCPASPSTTIALLLTTTTHIQVAKEETQPRRYFVLVGCSLCFLSSFTCTIVLLAHWLLKRSCIVFLKLQCSVSITGVMLTIGLVTLGEDPPPERIFANVLALLETLLLMGMSAQVSTLLMVYTELVQVPSSKLASTSKQTVIGMSAGVPVIAVFGNHLAHRTMDIRLKSWWLLVDTLAFRIFVTVSIVIIVLFVFLYVTVMGKLRQLTAVDEKDKKLLKKRIILLKRSAFVFVALVVVTGSSIAYINFSDVIWWHYEFSVSTMLLGLVLIISYVIKSETEFYYLFHTKFQKTNKPKDNNLFGVECTGSPLNFFTKEEADVESESIPHRRKSEQHSSSTSSGKSIECFAMTDACKSGLPECVSGTMESSYTTDAIYCAQTSLRNDAIERYNRSPQAYRKNITFKMDIMSDEVKNKAVACRSSPDIIASKNCTELDLVASHAPSIIITPEESISPILNTGMMDEWRKRPQPDGREIAADDKIEQIESKLCTDEQEDDNLDGMLERISLDLDYLLDRNEELPPQQTTTAGPRVLKPLVEDVIAEESEEDIKVPEAITDILRTSC